MKKTVILIFSLFIIFCISCNNKQNFSSLEKVENKSYNNCIENNIAIKERIDKIITNQDVLIPLKESNPDYDKSEFCYEFYGEYQEGNIETSALLVLDFIKNTIAIAYQSSEIDSIVYLLEDEEKIPMPIHFIMEEEFLNNME